MTRAVIRQPTGDPDASGELAPPPAVERLWFLERLSPAAAGFRLPVALRWPGTTDAGRLERAVRALVARHDGLRMRLPVIGSRPRLGIGPDTVPFRVLAVETGSPETRRSRLDQAIAHATGEPFDLECGPLVRASWLELDGDEGVLLLDVHHAVVDMPSTMVIAEELREIDAALSEGRPVRLPPAPQLRDYVRWLAGSADPRRIERAERYWSQRLAGIEPADIPVDRPRPAIQSFVAGSAAVDMDVATREALGRLAAGAGVGVADVLLATWIAVVSRWTGQSEVAVALPVPEPGRGVFPRLVALLLNVVVLRIDLADDPGFDTLVGRVSAGLREALYHRGLPFDRVVRALGGSRDPSRPPLAQVSFTFRREPTFDLVPVGAPSLEYEMALDASERPDGVSARLMYSTALFDPVSVEHRARQFATALRALVSDLGLRVSEAPLVDEAERHALLGSWNPVPPQAAGRPGVSARFRAQARRRPDSIAVVDAGDGSTRSYAAMHRRVEAIASGLRERGVKPGDLVGLHLERGADLPAAILAVLDCGAAYLPLDPGYPRRRLEFMVGDAGARSILTSGIADAPIPTDPGRPPVEAWRVDDVARSDPDASAPAPDPAALAYVIYTSGSTGRPKGVEVRRASLASLLESMLAEPGARDDDTWLAVTPFSFDIAAAELLLPLVAGARLVTCPREAAADPGRLAGLLDRHEVTVMQATPATWRLLVDSGWRGRAGLRALCGGEALPRPLAGALLERCAEVWNLYGPTETTIWSSVERVGRGDDAVAIGRPLANTRAYVLDAHDRLAPVGTPGQLHLGGSGVAVGYRGRPELTSERFVADPFVPGGRMFRTGDRARWRPDGRLEFLGRLDRQIKLRGFRIEPAEVEAALADHPDVEQAAVGVRDVAGDPRLVAWLVVPPGRCEPPASGLREHLRLRLPEFMVPTHFVPIAALPLTPAGKLDQQALPDPRPRGSGAPGPGVSPTEGRLLEVWRVVLGLERPPAPDDDFFDLGGHSLLAVELLRRTEAEIGRRIPLSWLFLAPTVRRFAAALDGADQPSAGDASLIVPVQPAGQRPPLFVIPAPAFMFRHRINIVGLRNLAARLGPDQPLYAFCLPDGEPQYHPARFPELAERLGRELVAAGFADPIHTAGYSLGGRVAVLLGRWLAARGRRPGRVVLLDTAGPGCPRAPRGLERLHPSRLRALARGRLARRRRPRPADAPPLQEPPPPGLENSWSFDGADAAPLVARLVRSAHFGYDERGLAYDDPANHWSRVRGLDLAVEVVPGTTHDELLDDPFVEAVASLVRRALSGEW